MKLTSPVEVAGIKYTELKVRKPRARDFADLPVEVKTLGDFYPLAANLCDVDRAVIDALDVEDLMAIINEVGGFLSKGRMASPLISGGNS